jgi:hypothetical protein
MGAKRKAKPEVDDDDGDDLPPPPGYVEPPEEHGGAGGQQAERQALPRLREAKVEPLLLPLIELANDACKYPYDRDGGRLCVLRLDDNGVIGPILPGTPRSLLYLPRSQVADRALKLGGVSRPQIVVAVKCKSERKSSQEVGSRELILIIAVCNAAPKARIAASGSICIISSAKLAKHSDQMIASKSE